MVLHTDIHTHARVRVDRRWDLLHCRVCIRRCGIVCLCAVVVCLFILMSCRCPVGGRTCTWPLSCSSAAFYPSVYYYWFVILCVTIWNMNLHVSRTQSFASLCRLNGARSCIEGQTPRVVERKIEVPLYSLLESLFDYPERWITWLVGRWRTQLIARQLVNCRTHEHRHFERTLRSLDTVPGPLLAEGRFYFQDCPVRSLRSFVGAKLEVRISSSPKKEIYYCNILGDPESVLLKQVPPPRLDPLANICAVPIIRVRSSFPW